MNRINALRFFYCRFYRYKKLMAFGVLVISFHVPAIAKPFLFGELTKLASSFSEPVRSYPPATVRSFASGSQYELCFVPDGPSCESLLVNEINNTNNNLFIQAYSFTSAPIVKAIIQAKNRGVDVQVLVDKSQKTEKYSVITTLQNASIPVFIDDRPAIAHNKVMIFDQSAVFTGSFNFTASAQARNAENGILIFNDPEIVKQYSTNWLVRYKQSKQN